MSQALVQSTGATGIDQVGNRFGFGQIDAAVEEGAAAEFAWLSDPCALRCRQHDDFANQVNASMAMELGDVLPGQASRRRHQYAHRMVEHFAILGIANVAELKLVGYDSGRLAPR